MNAPSLQDGIDRAGSPVRLLWKPGSAPWSPPVVRPEYAGWATEQEAWRSTVVLSDLSFHMSDMFLEGTGALALLHAVSANSYRSFAIGQAKQFIPVAADGQLVTDGILLRTGEESFTLSGVPAAQNWVAHHATAGGYDVAFEIDPDRAYRPDDPRLFRLQVQGPLALDLVQRAFGAPLPETKFFHSTEVTLDGRRFRALRHGMAGQAGYEFIGDYTDHDAVLEALQRAGEPLGATSLGGLAYATNGIESGWIPTPTPAIYSDPALEDYRRSLSLFSFEGQNPLYGSFYSDDIDDFTTSPWELGYGRSLSFDHDFIGRDSLEAARESTSRTKVTLEFDAHDARAVLGADDEYALSYGRYRVENHTGLVGTAFYTARIAPVGTVLSLALVDRAVDEPGTEVEVVWGDHPGHGTPAEVELGLPRVRAVVRPSPYDAYARTAYRAARL
ncbi:aminomethyl transferase family protein [Herbiconiux moechotypicola]|uniref:Aminomethyltransferase family protein n=1 Tax=Herbiconiux moechotypicola TaxID=637393 RepID=A0ABP5Q983_9MICO|nr:aminomethyl transferase family protein [Herbiconiux moechotypicola]MCS5729371.1 aminomethyl transferase family protein [Herbiconiux moechotypicola]